RKLYTMKLLTLGDFFKVKFGKRTELVASIFTLYTEKVNPDFFQDVLQFVISRFTIDTHIYFAVIALLLGFFVAKIVASLRDYLDENSTYSFISFLLILFVIVLLAPSRIGSFRHYFASVVFIYSVYQYFITNKKKYLIWLLFPAIIHFAYLMILPVMIIHNLVGHRIILYYILIALSFIFYKQTAQLVNETAGNYETYTISKKAQDYSNQRYLLKVSKIKEKRIYILDKYTYITTIAFLGLSIFFFYFFKQEDRATVNLYCLSLLMFFLINLFQSLESVFNRFGVVFQVICCMTLIRTISWKRIRIPNVVFIVLLLLFVVNAVIAIRFYIQYASVSSILIGLPIALYDPLEVTVLEFFFR
ncbi:MAG: EpsG family protein, partial [Cyclobacteriaceae bacterium]|nr:EpsG family protein [Cyclobacteriaceae bacterium]